MCLTLHQQASFWLYYDVYYCIYLLYHIIYEYTHSLILKSYISKFYFVRFLGIFQQQQVLLYYAFNAFLYNYPITIILLLYFKFTALSTRILSALRLDSSKNFWKALIFFLTHSKKRTLLLNPLNNCI